MLVACALSLGAGAACRQDMHDQPKIKAYREADFFADRRGTRPIPEHTVARGFLNDDDHLFTGKVNGQYTDEFPFQVTRDVLQRGHDRFSIYCTPCHGQTGNGQRHGGAARASARRRRSTPRRSASRRSATGST